jgi:hypothetical protein
MTWVPHSHWRSGLLTARALLTVLTLPRGSAVHVHLSQGGSFARKAVILSGAWARGLRRVVTIHGPDFEGFATAHPRLVARVLGMASAVTVLSEPDLALVRELAPRTPSEVLLNPMQIAPAPVPVAETGEVVLFAGEVGLRKGADVLHRAWGIVAEQRPGARCVMVGPGTDLRLPDGERLEVRGAVERREIQRLLCEARVVALPSRGEALPMILSEAMAAGRPFVATPTGGIPSLADGGMIVPVGDHEALAGALIELLSDPERARSLAERGQEMCRERMSPEAIGSRLAELYA